MLGDALQHARQPGVQVTRVAALDEDGESARRHAAGDVSRLQLAAQLGSQFIHHVLDGNRAQFGFERRESVRLEVGDGANARLEQLRYLHGALVEERRALEQARGRVVPQGFLELARERRKVALLRRYAHAHRGLAFELEALEFEVHCEL